MNKPTRSSVLESVLVLEMVRVTEAAAIAASQLIGRGNEKAADAAAVPPLSQSVCSRCSVSAGRVETP